MVVVVLWFLFRKSSAQAFMQYSTSKVIKAVHRGYRTHFIYLPWALKVIALGLVIVALARPRESSTNINAMLKG
ncbi:MAG: hypothetical protein R2827_06770 [Bdellovibrionales bacterium]